MKKTYLILLLLPLIALTLNPGDEVTFEYGDNQSEVIICTEDNPGGVCAQKTISLTVDPGESQTVTDDYCTASVSCSEPVINQTRCFIDVDLSPGETLEVFNEACDVTVYNEYPDLSVRDSKGRIIQHREKIELVKNGDYIKAWKLDGINKELLFEFPVADKASEMSALYDVEFVCPETTAYFADDDPSEYLKQCRQFLPLAMTNLAYAINVSTGAVREHADDLKTYQERIDSLSAELGSLKAEKTRSEVLLSEQKSANTDKLINAENALIECKNKLSNWSFGFYFLLIISCLLCLLLFIALWYIKNGGGLQ